MNADSEESSSASSKTEARSGWRVRMGASNLPLAIALLAALAIFLGVVNQHYPITQWLAWRYLGVATLACAWGLSVLGGGYFLLDRLRIKIETADVEAVLAFALGVFAFQTAIFLLGLAHLLGYVTFGLLPAAFAFAGRRRLREALRRAARQTPTSSLSGLVITLFGVLGTGLLYFQILSPEAFSWDARWYHLPIAQQYALDGAVRPSPEGWWLAGYPHGASLLYTWAFLLPGVLLFDRLELCAHLEFVTFVATIASIPTLVRALVPRLRAQGAWAAIFLFPGIFLYDGNLCAGADHIAALWCIPVALTVIRLWKTWEPRQGLLFGIFMAAGISSKFSAWSMLLLPGFIFLARAAWLKAMAMARPAGADGMVPAPVGPAFVTAAAAALLFSTQYWLRNWIWYGDPMYPVLHGIFAGRPWSSESSTSYRLFKSFTSQPAPGLEGLKDALVTTLTFSFKPNNWPVFHRNVPIIGSLFTLTMLCLPFVRAGARLWLAYLGVLMAIVAWYLTTHQDRYLQTFMPAIVACTVATLAMVWQRRSHLLRGLVVALVAAQIVWGADVPFFPTHNLLNDSPIRVVSNFLASGFLKTPHRLRLYGDEGLVAERLPPDAVLLMHEANLHVGFGVRAVNDQWQGRLSYASLASPRAVYQELADMRVTHLGWQQKMSGWNSVGHNLAFLGFALNHARESVALGIYTLARFPAAAPTAPFNDSVAMLACGNPYPNGFYRVSKLQVPDSGQPWASPDGPITDVPAAIRAAGFLVVDPACTPRLPPEVEQQFHRPIGRGPLQLYVRRT